MIKAFAFRGSMHYLSPEDGGIYLALRSAGRQWELPSWVEYYRLAPSDWPDFRAAVREALSDGPLTIAELGEALARHRAYRHLKPVFDEGAGTLIKPLTWQGDMSFGPPRDGQHTFQRLDLNPRWTGVPDLDDAGPRAITAYLRTYGPATFDHVHYWLGNGLSAGRKRLDTLAVRARATSWSRSTSRAPRRTSCARTSTPSSPRGPRTRVRFLPGHDQWVMGPGTKDVHVTPPSRRDLVTRKANPVIVGGVVCGTWARKGDELTVTWLDERRRPDEAIEQESRATGRHPRPRPAPEPDLILTVEGPESCGDDSGRPDNEQGRGGGRPFSGPRSSRGGSQAIVDGQEDRTAGAVLDSQRQAKAAPEVTRTPCGPERKSSGPAGRPDHSSVGLCACVRVRP